MKTYLITGSSRGIGLAIAKKLAQAEKANIIIAAKTTEPHPKLEGTIFTAAEQVEKAGGRALPLQMDVRDEESIKSVIDQGVAKFGGLDGVILNASAIILGKTHEIGLKKFDLMHQVIVRGHYATVHHALPHLQKSKSPSVLGLCPPSQNASEKWMAPHLAYSLMKFGLSLMVRGWAGELRPLGIQVNALWPKTLIATAAVQNLLGGDAAIRRSRKPEIMADAAYWILQNRDQSGQFFYDEDVIKKLGQDPHGYALDPSQKPLADIYVD
ncbi:MAG: SDR family oxidoreductase [Bdellovibrionales bacterium]